MLYIIAACLLVGAVVGRSMGSASKERELRSEAALRRELDRVDPYADEEEVLVDEEE